MSHMLVCFFTYQSTLSITITRFYGTYSMKYAFSLDAHLRAISAILWQCFDTLATQLILSVVHLYFSTLCFPVSTVCDHFWMNCGNHLWTLLCNLKVKDWKPAHNTSLLTKIQSQMITEVETGKQRVEKYRCTTERINWVVKVSKHCHKIAEIASKCASNENAHFIEYLP